LNRPPNILLVIVDDMGVHQLGCYGSGFYETPHLDRLAGEGVRFDTAYSASPVCSPSRAALYTGLHPARLHLTNYIPGTEPANPRLLTPPWRPYLPVEAVTLGDAFKGHGYATGHFGKWHLAPDYHYRPGRPMDPESQGFDDVVVTRKPLATADPEGDPHHIDQLTSEAIRFLSVPRSQPFLCVVAHNALHRPELAPAALVARHAAKSRAESNACRPVLGAMVERVDASIGRLLQHVRTTGRDEDTIVVFTSDHGALGRSSERKPLRGAKADLYEGGIRVPLLVRWAGRLPPGVRSAAVVGTDLLPTLLDLAGLPVPPDRDGASLRRILFSTAAPAEHDTLYWHFPHYHHLGIAPCGALRAGRWKLIEWFEGSMHNGRAGAAYELYDLDADPGESRNLADTHPSRCAELAERLRDWRRQVGAQEMRSNPRYNPLEASSAAPPPGDPGNPFGE
jgi:arylsulfatase A